MVTSAKGDVTVLTTSAASSDRIKALEDRGVRVVVADGPNGRTDMRALVDLLARERHQSLMIEAGSKVNWAALEYGIVDKVFFYYAPKIFGGVESLPVVGGTGRRRKSDAILLHDLRVQAVATDEFAVEAWVVKEP
jgi:diaminohydroxyphosphoribosylaminopyrimidine deaminase/5-amino-6-(5-phosphoribosylamino)uracil reductase